MFDFLLTICYYRLDLKVVELTRFKKLRAAIATLFIRELFLHRQPLHRLDKT